MAVATLTADGVRARIINGLAEPIRRVMQASDETQAAYAAFKAEQTPGTGIRFGRALGNLEASVSRYLVAVGEDVLMDEEPMARMCARVTNLEGALKALVDESLQRDNRGERPALQQAIAVLRPAGRAQ